MLQDTTDWPQDKRWKHHLRVDDLDAMARQLRDRGIQVDIDPEVDPHGRICEAPDPERNPSEQWEAH